MTGGRGGSTYCLKYIKEKASWPFPDMPPGQPIISDCGCESYGVAELIDFYLNPLIHKSYIKDTYEFLEKVWGLKLNKEVKHFSMDIESLYTNIETERGIATVRKCFEKYPNEDRLEAAILKLLESY